MAWLDTIKLGFGNNLILGNLPNKAKLSQLSKKVAEEVHKNSELRSFGLFDSNTSNYNTYFPEVTAKDLTPKDSEFIKPVFRALSEVVVHKEWNPVDFSRNFVLKKSMYLLKGQTVNVDHEIAVGNAIGAVSNVAWQDSYKTEKNIIIPAGINSVLKIDGKSHPRLSRAIMMDPPAIHSTSVTVQFLWEKSHPSMTQEDFFKNLGTYDADGKLITRVASDIKKYHEISLVSHGADPFAQKINKDGVINNPRYAISENSASAVKEKKRQKLFFFDFKTDVISNAKNISIPKKINTINNNLHMKKLILVLATALNIKLDENKPDLKLIKNKLASLSKRGEDVSTLKSQLDEVNKKLKLSHKKLTAEQSSKKELEAKVNKLSKYRTRVLTSLRKEAIKAFSILSKGSPAEKTLEMLKKADYATLNTLLADYKVQLEEKFPLTCKDCESHNISRSSALLSDKTSEKIDPNELKEHSIKNQSSKAITGMH